VIPENEHVCLKIKALVSKLQINIIDPLPPGIGGASKKNRLSNIELRPMKSKLYQYVFAFFLE